MISCVPPRVDGIPPFSLPLPLHVVWPVLEDATIEPEEQHEDEQPPQREIDPRETGHIHLMKNPSEPD